MLIEKQRILFVDKWRTVFAERKKLFWVKWVIINQGRKVEPSNWTCRISPSVECNTNRCLVFLQVGPPAQRETLSLFSVALATFPMQTKAVFLVVLRWRSGLKAGNCTLLSQENLMWRLTFFETPRGNSLQRLHRSRILAQPLFLFSWSSVSNSLRPQGL